MRSDESGRSPAASPQPDPIEETFVFECHGASLPAVLHRSTYGADTGVLVVVGGPQYRVGSHRQFVLLARRLAERGVPTLRFDYRGMGDAGGDPVTFDNTTEDIRAAVDTYMERVPGLRRVVIWGLCDAASAATFYAWHDDRIAGLVLLNPWVRTESGEAKAFIKHYYGQRLISAAFWRRLVTGQVGVLASLRDMLRKLRASTRAPDPARGASLPDRMADGLARFTGPVLLILSGQDLTAGEFKDVVAESPRWGNLINRPEVLRIDLPDANHTFSDRAAHEAMVRHTITWLTDTGFRSGP